MRALVVVVALILVGCTVVWLIDSDVASTQSPNGPSPTQAEHEAQSEGSSADYGALPVSITLPDSNAREIFPGNLERAKRQVNLTVFQKSVVFPDGEQILITYNHTPIRRERIDHLDDGISGEFYSPLSVAAGQGNPVAAVALVRALEACSNAPKTDVELSSAVDYITRSGISPPTTAPIEQQVAHLNRAYARCRGVTPDMYNRALTHLTNAADAGSKLAAAELANRLIQSDAAAAEKYYRFLWQSGDPIGASGLSEVYFARDALSHEDLVEGFAYAYVAYMIETAKYDGLSDPLHGRIRGGLAKHMSDIEARVPEYIVREAVPLAKELLKSNLKCCR